MREYEPFDKYSMCKLTTTSNGIKALWDWMGTSYDVLMPPSDVYKEMRYAWSHMTDFMRWMMLDRKETIMIESEDGLITYDLYEWLWDTQAVGDLIQYFCYDFLDDVRKMSHEEFNRTFAPESFD